MFGHKRSSITEGVVLLAYPARNRCLLKTEIEENN